MPRTFKIDLNGSAEQLVAKANYAARRDEIIFEGDTNLGTFQAWGVKGNYTIEDGTVLINVTEKPLLIPWPIVEEMVKKFFS